MGGAVLAGVFASPAVAEDRWRDVSPPDLPLSRLHDVESVGTETWAVGFGDRADGGTSPIAVRWNGRSWDAPPQPYDGGRLVDVAVAGPGQVWAAGAVSRQIAPKRFETRPLLQRWNGSAWSEVATPFPGGDGAWGYLESVAADPGGNVYVAGGWGNDNTGQETYGVFRRDPAGNWSLTPGSELVRYAHGLAFSPAGTLYAVSGSTVARFERGGWVSQKLPDDLGDVYYDAIEFHGNQIWVVGNESDAEVFRRSLVVHFDGRRWTKMATPHEESQLFDVAVTRDGRPVFTGETQNKEVNPDGNYVLTVGSDGALTRSQEPPGSGPVFGATTASDGTVWAVGTSTLPADGGPGSSWAGIRR
ncbi:hypothetical protein [Uniformispora flossi]|uniref:hypothetical protein n=1 Tax=Uniformispora flossi TaxID=3390723 RepID=UPI003CFD89A5